MHKSKYSFQSLNIPLVLGVNPTMAVYQLDELMQGMSSLSHPDLSYVENGNDYANPERVFIGSNRIFRSTGHSRLCLDGHSSFQCS